MKGNDCVHIFLLVICSVSFKGNLIFIALPVNDSCTRKHALTAASFITLFLR